MDKGSLTAMIASSRVQLNLPDLDSPLLGVKFVHLNQATPLIYPRSSEDVRQNLLAIAFSLCKHEKRADIWKTAYKKAAVHFLTFILHRMVLNEQQLTPPADPSQTLYAKSMSLISSKSSLLDFDLNLLPELMHEDFEYLYYAIVCKIKELYHDLQVRLACNFITMDHLLHTRGIDCRSKADPCTVRDFRNFVCLAWHLLRDDTLRSQLDEAIKNRKIAILDATMLAQPYAQTTSPFSINDVPERRSMNTSVVRSTTRGLQSLDNPPMLLDIIAKRYKIGKHIRPLSSPITGRAHLEMLRNTSDLKLIQTRTKHGQTKRLDVDFDGFGNVLSALPCRCGEDCDCKIVCSKFPDMCVCLYRQRPLGASPQRLVPHFRLQSPPHGLKERDSPVRSPYQSRVSQHDGSPDAFILTPSKSPGHRSRSKMIRSPSAPALIASSPKALPGRSMSRVLDTMSFTKTKHQGHQSFLFDDAGNDSSSPSQYSLPPTPPPKMRRVSETNPSEPSICRERKNTFQNISYRVPFAENQFFQSSPVLPTPSPPRKIRYVSAGGILPVNQRQSVDDPFIEERSRETGPVTAKEKVPDKLFDSSLKANAGSDMTKRKKSAVTSRIRDRISRMFER